MLLWESGEMIKRPYKGPGIPQREGFLFFNLNLILYDGPTGGTADKLVFFFGVHRPTCLSHWSLLGPGCWFRLIMQSGHGGANRRRREKRRLSVL